jgi:hypothetical protein
MKNESDEPQPAPALATTSLLSTHATRHDGWTGEKMAAFCESLAETAVVAEACEAARMGISGAYAARRRNPLFAAAWDAALSIARGRLADTLLARSMEGNIELLYRDGELVGEKHVLDNRLGLAILRRLDRLAETGMTISSRGERFVLPGAKQRAPAILPAEQSLDWEAMVGALQAGDDEGVAKALALLEGDEVEEVEDPPVSLSQGDTDGDLDLWDRCWKDAIEDIWLTNFPPPEGFDGYQRCQWGDPDEIYERACTAEEIAILDRHTAADRAVERGHDEKLRDTWFALLADELEDEEEEKDVEDGEEAEAEAPGEAGPAVAVARAGRGSSPEAAAPGDAGS